MKNYVFIRLLLVWKLNSCVTVTFNLFHFMMRMRNQRKTEKVKNNVLYVCYLFGTWHVALEEVFNFFQNDKKSKKNWKSQNNVFYVFATCLKIYKLRYNKH